MKIYFVATILSLMLFSCSSFAPKREIASSDSLKSHIEMVSIPGINLKLRAGYFSEKEKLRGCVLFLQGLGDSMRNHAPYFKSLSEAGYRLISFDYMGQGGSEGTMNKTRLSTGFPPDVTEIMLKKYHQKEKYYEIGHQANYIWDTFSKVKNEEGESCVNSKKRVIGWSTGGLAAYKMAKDKLADAVVLIAPGIHIKFMVGEAKKSPSKLFFLQQVITERTLTRNRFQKVPNPHIDPIKPTSPAQIPQFSGNLYLTSKESQGWKISKDIPGTVFLSGLKDTYVDRDRTINTIRKNSSHFEISSYDGALHELDNEIDKVTNDLYSKTILFFNSI